MAAQCLLSGISWPLVAPSFGMRLLLAVIFERNNFFFLVRKSKGFFLFASLRSLLIGPSGVLIDSPPPVVSGLCACSARPDPAKKCNLITKSSRSHRKTIRGKGLKLHLWLSNVRPILLSCLLNKSKYWNTTYYSEWGGAHFWILVLSFFYFFFINS